MQWNLYLTIRGPRGITEVPNTNNPIEADGMADLFTQAAEAVPNKVASGLVRVVGTRFILADEDNTDGDSG